MAQIFTFKVGDSAPPLTATLLDGNSVAVSLVGASVSLRITKRQTDLHFLTVVAEIVNPTTAVVRYSWSQLLAQGSYRADFIVTFSDGTKSSFPNDQDFLIEVIGQP